MNWWLNEEPETGRRVWIPVCSTNRSDIFVESQGVGDKCRGSTRIITKYQIVKNLSVLQVTFVQTFYKITTKKKKEEATLVRLTRGRTCDDSRCESVRGESSFEHVTHKVARDFGIVNRRLPHDQLPFPLVFITFLKSHHSLFFL